MAYDKHIFSKGDKLTAAQLNTMNDEIEKLDEYMTEAEQEVPTALSQLTDDSTHRLVTDSEKSTWNAKQDAISDIATIRSNASIASSLEIGGRNLVSNLPSNWSNGNWSTPAIGAQTKIVSNSTRASLKNFLPVVPTNTYHIKIYSGDSLKRNILLRQLDSDGLYLRTTIGLKDDNWTAPEDCYSVAIGVYENTTLDDITSGNVRIKIEDGNIATDWSPSPDDKQDVLTAGDNVTIVDNVISADINQFWAVYGETSFDDIMTAYNAGKAVFCDYNSKQFQLTYYSATIATFIAFSSSTVLVYLQFKSAGTWSNGSLSLQKALTAGDNITIASDGTISANVPTDDHINALIDAKIAAMQTS